MLTNITKCLLRACCLFCLQYSFVIAQESPPGNQDFGLSGDWVPADPRMIHFDSLPRVPGEHAVVSDVTEFHGTRVNQHAYLVHHGGCFMAMWSDGPGQPKARPGAHTNLAPGHDLAGQLVKYAISADGISWSEGKDLAGAPDAGFGWIARGFWVRNGQLLALAARFRAPGFTGEGLQLRAFEWNTTDSTWKPLGLVYDDAINNFPPKQIRTGEWMMSRRDHKRNVYFLTGGVRRFDDWHSSPLDMDRSALSPDEPFWWELPDGKTLLALLRDNRRQGFLFYSLSVDDGRSWTAPQRSDFPDAASKFCGIRLPDGRYLLVSSPRPGKRDPLTLSVSDDGLHFHSMFYLVGGRLVDYPHIIEHDGYLYIAFSGAKQTVEVLKIDVSHLAIHARSKRN